MPEDSQLTVRAVLVEARRLRERAEAIRRNDPWAKPYDPSEATARKLSQQHGPARAIEIMGTRAGDADQEYREQCERADRAQKRHRKHLAIAESVRRERLSELTVGQRLDRALRGMSATSTVPSSGSDDGPRVHGGDRDHSPRTQESDAERFRSRALILVKDAEDALERATPASLWPDNGGDKVA